MKILMLADVFYPDTTGGAGRVAYYLSKELSDKGNEVHVLTRNKEASLPFFETLNENLFVYRFFVPPTESLRLFISEVKNSYFLAKKLINDINFDLVCIHQSMPAIAPLFLHQIRRTKIFYFFYSPWHEEYITKKRKNNTHSIRNRVVASMMRWLERRTILKAQKVVVLSRFSENQLHQTHKYPRKKIIEIPGGIDLDGFNLPVGYKTSPKRSLELPTDRTVFLTVRNLVPRMGIEALVQAFSESDVLKKKGLLVVGGKGFLRSALESMVHALGASESIRFVGYIPEKDLIKFYQAADFFVLPTKILEGFGLVILEAMASGTPVLGTPVGAIPEVLGAFDKNLLFQGTGWDDIKKKLEEVILHPTRYAFSAETCRDYVEKNFSWEKFADKFLREVNNLNA